MNTNKSKSHEIIATVVCKGNCKYYKEGTTFKLTGFTPKGICDSAYAALSRDAYALRYGAKIPWQGDEDSLLTHCPDPKGATWELRRVRTEKETRTLEWDDESQSLLKKIPFFVRKSAKRRIEDFVRSENRNQVTTDDVKKAKARFLEEIDKHEGTKLTDPGEQVKLYEVTVCKGHSLGCPFGIADTQKLARTVEEKLEEIDVAEFIMERTSGPLLPHHRFKVAIAGCPNGCAQPQIKDFGIIAQAVPERNEEGGKCTQCGLCVETCSEGAISLEDRAPKFDRNSCVNCGMCAAACPNDAITIAKKGYRLLVGGRLGRHPRLGEELIPLASETDVLKILEACIKSFKSHGKSDERFSEFVERVGTSHLLAEIGS